MPLTQPDIDAVSGLFDRVRKGFATVAEQATHVTINDDRIADYARFLQKLPPEKILDPQHHFYGTEEETASYILTLDSINFGSGYAPHMRKEGWEMVEGSIYYTLSTRLKEYFENKHVLTAADLKAMTADDCKALLGLKDGQYSNEFAQMCAKALNEMGQAVEGTAGGSFLGYVENAQGSAERMIAQLLQLENFRDIHSYKGSDIPFLKRAQITAADLHLAFLHHDWVLFDDIESLTMFADNGVPHVLFMDGIIGYTDELKSRIENGEEIKSGSDEEIEIRGCAGHVVELIAREKGMKAMDIDHILWHRSVEDDKYDRKYSHITLSRFY